MRATLSSISAQRGSIVAIRGLAAAAAASLLLFTFGTPAMAQSQPAPKKIRIYNNSTAPLYPVLNIGGTATDEWLMAWFEVGKTDPNDARRYPRNDIARIYICETAGIPANKWIEVTVPFFSRRVASPTGTAPDEFLNWWNGGRIVFYDDQTQIQNNMAGDTETHPIDAGPTVTGGTTTCPVTLRMFTGTLGLPPEDRSQLMEYTFADAITAKGLPYEFNASNVGYNISSVDQVYLPVAMQPLVAQNTIGYIGTTTSLSDFRGKLTSFLADYPGWPVYNYKVNPLQPPPPDKPRVPSGATVFFDGYTVDPSIPYNNVLSPQPPQPNGATEKLVQLFDNCASGSPTHAICPAYAPIIDLFKKNLASWKLLRDQGKCVAPLNYFPDSKVLMLRKIYGWVPFNEGCTCSGLKTGEKCNVNDLVGTAGSQAEFTKLQKSYITQLQDGRYASPPSYDFNPYVKLIHDASSHPKYLSMAAYAFSVDDAIGFQSYPADGLVITLAGCEGLSPCEKLDKSKRVIISMGLPRVGVTYWATNTRCDPQFTKNFDPKFPTVEFYPTKYPCPFTSTDLRGKKYEFVITSPPPRLEVQTCPVQEWCQGVNVSEQDGERNYIAAPQASAGPKTSSHDYDGNGASDIGWRYSTASQPLTPVLPWLMQGSKVIGVGDWGSIDKTWSIVSHRDFDGDGKNDLLWQDTSGNAAIWFLDGGKLVPRQETTPGQFVEPVWGLGQIAGWGVAGTGDFNGDGMGDILWRNTTSGEVAVWLVNGRGRKAPNEPNGSVSFGNPGANWVIAGVGDFDGKVYGRIAGVDQTTADILWRDTVTGTVAMWFINGITIDSAKAVATISTDWQIVGTGDFDGDGKFDLLWRHTDGSVAVWLMNGNLVKDSGGLGSVPSDWTVQMTGDYDFDGKSDILWRNTSTGDIAVWFMNGKALRAGEGVGAVADPDWHIQSMNAN